MPSCKPGEILLYGLKAAPKRRIRSADLFQIPPVPGLGTVRDPPVQQSPDQQRRRPPRTPAPAPTAARRSGAEAAPECPAHCDHAGRDARRRPRRTASATRSTSGTAAVRKTSPPPRSPRPRPAASSASRSASLAASSSTTQVGTGDGASRPLFNLVEHRIGVPGRGGPLPVRYPVVQDDLAPAPPGRRQRNGQHLDAGGIQPPPPHHLGLPFRGQAYGRAAEVHAERFAVRGGAACIPAARTPARTGAPAASPGARWRRCRRSTSRVPRSPGRAGPRHAAPPPRACSSRAGTCGEGRG
ncbi:hypothetical protein SALBM311S_06393 [Streptomyces alboniger]